MTTTNPRTAEDAEVRDALQGGPLLDGVLYPKLTVAEAREVITPDPEADDRPTWTWTNNLRNPQSIHVEPSFKTELGLVFIGIGERGEDGTWKAGDSHHGIWLDRDQCLRLNRAVKEAATWSENNADEETEW